MSELTTRQNFLSCLCGSEGIGEFQRRMLVFLSCLCGSEERERQEDNDAPFLSCLCGSEDQGATLETRKCLSKLPVRQ